MKRGQGKAIDAAVTVTASKQYDGWYSVKAGGVTVDFVSSLDAAERIAARTRKAIRAAFREVERKDGQQK